MANKKYVDENGLAYFWSQLKLLFNNKVDKITGKGLSTNDYTDNEKTKLAGIAAGAEVNQNAFTKVTVGETQLVADQKQDILTLTAGNNVTLIPNANTDTVTIAATDTTYSEATTSTAGLMSSSDKTKLNGIASGAEVNQNAFSNVKVGSTTIQADGKTDTLELAGGTNITLTPDATNDKVTIATTAQVNVIESIKVNGTAQTVTNKAVNIAVPTKTSDLTNDSDYITSTDYATTDKGGVIKKYAGNNFNVLDSGFPSCTTSTYSEYTSGGNTKFISKGTLENVITGKNLETANNKVTSISSSSTDTQYPSAKSVYTSIQNAIGSITQIEYRVVQTLPSTGEAGVIYLVPHSHGTQDIYDEYIWVTSTSTFEKIGNTDIDLSNYATLNDLNNYLAKAGGTMTGHLTMSDKSVILRKSDTNTYGAYKVESILHSYTSTAFPNDYKQYCLALDVTYMGKDAQGNTDINGINYYISCDGKIFKSTSNGIKYVVWDDDLADCAKLSEHNTFTGFNSFGAVVFIQDMCVISDDLDNPTRSIYMAVKNTDAGVDHSGFMTYGDATTEGLYIDDNLILTTGNMIAITNAEIDTILAS